MRLFIIASILLALAGCAHLEPTTPDASAPAKTAVCANMVGEDRLVCDPI